MDQVICSWHQVERESLPTLRFGRSISKMRKLLMVISLLSEWMKVVCGYMGTPWAGKESWQKNVAVPLKGICLLGRGEENRIEQILPYIMRQIHYTDETKMAGRTQELLNVMMADMPVCQLECDVSWGSRWGRSLVDFLVSLVGRIFLRGRIVEFSLLDGTTVIKF